MVLTYRKVPADIRINLVDTHPYYRIISCLPSRHAQPSRAEHNNDERRILRGFQEALRQ